MGMILIMVIDCANVTTTLKIRWFLQRTEKNQFSFVTRLSEMGMTSGILRAALMGV